MTLLPHAKAYLARGWSVIPLGARSKRPNIPSWREYQSRLATEDEIDEWFYEKEANIGVVTGAVSNMVVVDADGPEGLATAKNMRLWSPVRQLTGDGAHFAFAHPGRPVSNAVKKFAGIDVRGDGGYIVVAPSIHPSGREYKWEDGFGAALPSLPAPFLEEHVQTGNWIVKAIDEMAPGNRYNTLLRITGKLVHDKWDEQSIMSVLSPMLEKFNADGADRDAFVVAREMIRGLQKKDASKDALLRTDLTFKTFASHEAEYLRRKSGAHGLKTGFDRLDRILGGLYSSELFVVAARTGAGKTNFLTRLAKNLCLQGKKVLFFTTEMTFERIWDRYIQYGEGYKADNLIICDDVISRPAQISAAIAAVQPDVFLFDHINHTGGDNEMLTAYMHECKMAAQKFGIYGIVAAQLNRRADERENGARIIPRLSMIKGSGAIEEVAAQVLLLSDSDVDAEVRELVGVVDKNRYGEKGIISFVIRKDPYRFEEA